MKAQWIVGGLLLLSVMVGIPLAQTARRGSDAEPPALEDIINVKRPAAAQPAELIAIKAELPLGPADVLKEYAQAMALIAQGMSADVANISRAQDANQITREQAEFLIEERYQVAMMQYQVLSALHDTLEHDIALEAIRAKQVGAGRGPDTDVVVVLPSSAPSAQAK